MAQSSSNPFTIQVQAPAAGFASFTLTSAAGGASLPFTLGQAFRQGQVPAGKFVGSSLPGLQVTPKNTWPDGSLKFAILSGRATLAANTAKTYTLTAAGAAGTAAALGTAALRATNITAAVSAGSYGAASWSGADWAVLGLGGRAGNEFLDLPQAYRQRRPPGGVAGSAPVRGRRGRSAALGGKRLPESGRPHQQERHLQLHAGRRRAL
jgi:hypothetical protein